MTGESTDQTGQFVALGDMDKLGLCSECRNVTMWIGVKKTADGYEVVPRCSDHIPEVDG